MGPKRDLTFPAWLIRTPYPYAAALGTLLVHLQGFLPLVAVGAKGFDGYRYNRNSNLAANVRIQRSPRFNYPNRHPYSCPQDPSSQEPRCLSA